MVILPDYDDAGRDYAEAVAERCCAAGATSVRIVEWPDDEFDFPTGWDLADGDGAVLARDGSGRTFTTEDLHAVIASTRENEPSEPEGSCDGSTAGLESDDAIAFMNDRHFVVMAGGQAVVATERAH